MSFMRPKADKLHRDSFSSKIWSYVKLQGAVFLNQLKCCEFCSSLSPFLTSSQKKLSFDLDYYLSITANPVTSAAKTVITLSGNGVS